MLSCTFLSLCVCSFQHFHSKRNKMEKKKKKKKKHPVDKFLACLFLGMHHMHGRARPCTALRLSGLPRPVPSSPGNMWPGTCWSVQRGFTESDPLVKHHHTAWPRRHVTNVQARRAVTEFGQSVKLGVWALSCCYQLSSDQFSSRQYLDAWEGPLVLRPISQRFPQCSLSSGSVSEF